MGEPVPAGEAITRCRNGQNKNGFREARREKRRDCPPQEPWTVAVPQTGDGQGPDGTPTPLPQTDRSDHRPACPLKRRNHGTPDEKDGNGERHQT